MKRTLSLIVMTAMLAAIAAAQTPAKTTPPAATAKPATSATPAAATTPAAPAGKKLPQAKTKEEYDAYQLAAAKATPAELEAAAADFAAKYPASDLRVSLLANVMLQYQRKNDADKALEAARKVLQVEGDNTMALVMASTLIAEKTRETDLDRDQRYTEAMTDAQKAVDTIDTGLLLPPTFTAQQVADAKGRLVSMAQEAMGMVELNRKNDASAETHFRAALKASGGQADATLYYRLALTQDREKKYADALQFANLAVQNSAGDPSVESLAKQERDRLTKLTVAAPAAKPATTVPKK